MPNNMLAEGIARRIFEKLPAEAFTKEIANFDTAYAVQDEVALILAHKLGGVGGYKIAWNSQTQIAELSPNAPAVAHIFNTQVEPSGVRFPAASFSQLVIEPEIIAVIGQDITGPHQTPETVLPHIARFHAGFEIMDRRGSPEAIQSHPPSIVANNIFNNGLVIGEESAESVDFSTIETIVCQDGKEILRAIDAAPQHPALAVATVANNLAQRGKYLRAGDKVLCGTHMPPFVIEKGVLSVTMGILGGAEFSYG